MTENESQPEKKGFFKRLCQRFKNVFKSTSEKVADKVEDTVDDVKNSEFGEKVSDVAKNVSDKAKDMMEDLKESEFADKVGDIKDAVVDKVKSVSADVSKFCSEKIKKAISKIDFEKTLSSLRQKQETSGRDMSALINFVEKLQNIK